MQVRLKYTLLSLSLLPGITLGAVDLLGVVNSSLGYDPSYRSTVQTNNSTVAAVGVSRASLLPSLSGTVTKSWYGSTQTTDSSRTFSTSQGRQIGLSLSQSILNFSYYKTLASAKVSAIAALANTQTAYQTLLQTVASAYFNMASAQRTLEIDKEKLAVSKKVIQLARAQYKAGATLYTDVLTAKTTLLSAEQTLIADKKTWVGYQNTLSEHIPDPVWRVCGIKGVLVPKKEKKSNLALWVKKGLIVNPGLVEKKLDVLAAKKTLQAEKASLLPSVSASYSYSAGKTDYAGEAYTTLQASQSESNSFSVTLSVPLYQGGSVYASIKQDTYNFMAAKDTYNEQVNTVKSGISTYFESLQLETENIDSLKEAEVVNQKSYDAMIQAYQAGKETMVDVQNALSSLYSAKLSLVDAQYTFLTDYVTFKQSVGNLGMHDVRAINNWMHKHVQS
jgi:outer membrane protein